eukprot:scaffold418591_cov41-Prasinocladus_malaysianus.AAC.1
MGGCRCGHQVHLRMAANLVHIFKQSRDLGRLWQVLEILRTFHPTPDHLLMHAQLALYTMGDAVSAMSSLEQLKARNQSFPPSLAFTDSPQH